LPFDARTRSEKYLDEIKASFKQAVHVPFGFVSLGTQLKLFAVASSIFFGDESVCANCLKHLLHLVGQNKNSFRNLIALNEFFAARFPVTI
jgi:hypothetical protein